MLKESHHVEGASLRGALLVGQGSSSLPHVPERPATTRHTQQNQSPAPRMRALASSGDLTKNTYLPIQESAPASWASTPIPLGRHLR